MNYHRRTNSPNLGNSWISRRKFLGLSIGSLLSSPVLLSACSGSSTTKVAVPSICSLPKGLSKIEHVIIVMQENRSFDHYYGCYPGVRGFQDAIDNTPEILSQSFSANTTSVPVGKLLPFHFNTLTEPAACTDDINHSWAPQHMYWNQGKMNGFGPVHLQVDGPAAGRNTMGYYKRQDLSFYYSLASQFTICDAYHCSVLGPTHPNRVMSIAASIDPKGLHGGPILRTREDLAYEGSVSYTTMPERLSKFGISWKFYEPRGPLYTPGTAISAVTSLNPLLYFKQFLNPDSDLYKRAFVPSYPTDFFNDLATGNLPQVSWINLPDANLEHPPAPPLGGMQAMYELLSVLFAHPQIWQKTVLFLTYDENGGFFDHVNPPTAPKGTVDEYITNPNAPGANDITGPIGLGFRVPMLVISPFSQGGWVCSQTFDHTSILRFLETRFNVEVPNLSAWRRSITGDLTSALDWNLLNSNNLPPAPPNLEAPPSQLLLVDQQDGCNIGTVLGNEPTLPIPNPQKLPQQEQGTAKKRPVECSKSA
jgi:phospholipase C